MPMDEKDQIAEATFRFAYEMKERLQEKADEGWKGWDDPKFEARFLTRLNTVVDRVWRGEGDEDDYYDAAAYLMFLWWADAKKKYQRRNK